MREALPAHIYSCVLAAGSKGRGIAGNLDLSPRDLQEMEEGPTPSLDCK